MPFSAVASVVILALVEELDGSLKALVSVSERGLAIEEGFASNLSFNAHNNILKIRRIFFTLIFIVMQTTNSVSVYSCELIKLIYI